MEVECCYNKINKIVYNKLKIFISRTIMLEVKNLY
jgi:hypothetical protein